MTPEREAEIRRAVEYGLVTFADVTELLAALDEARAEKDAAITVIESLRDMLRDARDALDAANAQHTTEVEGVGVLSVAVLDECEAEVRKLTAALDEVRAENERFYRAGYDAGVDAQHGLTVFQMPAETMVQPVTVAVCRKCGKPIEAGWFRFGSDQTGWEHMEGECP